ncbi:MAG: hypothetical protein NT098_05315 [Candidatus Parcubacteria bacterium]|nr:hypothetical protein [Candidatus Parcubacteria bacterium]
MEQQEKKKPLYKRWWVWVVGIVMALIFTSGSDKTQQQQTAIQPEQKTEQVATATNEPIVKTTDTKAENKNPVPTEKPKAQTVPVPVKTETKPITVTPPPPAPTPIQPAQTDRAGMLAILKSNASTKWGSNYEMVKYEYDNQVVAYDWVVAQTKYPDIMTKAKQKWGNNFEMVKYEYNNQVKAYEWVQTQTAYPDIMASAKRKWGTNYEMVKYEYNNQVEAFKSL